jgi:2',3'-cyclic-nucleotide 2'-phosphodiesterase (5'-nucleotidase family)
MMAQAFAQSVPADVKLTFVELNDLHANLVSHKEQVRNADGSVTVGMRGGFSRIKTLVDDVKRSNPNTVVMNIGDTFHGGAEAFYTLGNAVADPLNALGIDIGVAGNWDYYFTPVITRLRYGRITGLEQSRLEASAPMFAEFFPIKRPNFNNLAANVKDFTDILLPKDFFDPTQIIVKNGVKIGFIGFTSDIVEQMHPVLAEGMDFAFGLEEHKNLIITHARALKSQGADIVVLMSELGIHKDIALMKALAAMKASGTVEANLLDMVFSAHTHELTREMVVTDEDGSTLYAPVVEPGNDSYMGRLDVTMKYVNSTTTSTTPKICLRRCTPTITTEQNWTASTSSKKWTVIEVTDTVAENAAVKTLVTTARKSFLAPTDGSAFQPIRALPFLFQMLREPINTVIGNIESGSIAHQNDMLSGVVSRKHAHDSTFNEAFSNMLLDVANDPANSAIGGAHVAVTPGFRMGASLPETGFLMENGAIASGNITLEDAYRFFPMYYGAAIGETTGADLKRRMEDSLFHVHSSDTFNHGGGWGTGFGGVVQQLDLTNGDPLDRYVPGSTPDTFTPGQLSRLLDAQYTNGQAIADSAVVRVFGCARLPLDYQGTLCGQPGFSNVQRIVDNNGLLGLGTPGDTYEGSTYEIAANGTIIAIGPRPATMIDLFVDRLKKGSKLKSAGDLVNQLDSFPMWSDSPYVQPLEGTGGNVLTAPSEDPCGYFKWKCLPNQPL